MELSRALRHVQWKPEQETGHRPPLELLLAGRTENGHFALGQQLSPRLWAECVSGELSEHLVRNLLTKVVRTALSHGDSGAWRRRRVPEARPHLCAPSSSTTALCHRADVASCRHPRTTLSWTLARPCVRGSPVGATLQTVHVENLRKGEDLLLKQDGQNRPSQPLISLQGCLNSRRSCDFS